MRYTWFIGLRYLKAKRRATFVSVITFISILGITVGVTALIIVLSVMTGFEEDLREKILGLNAHIVAMEFGADMKDYEDVGGKILSVEGVVAATPFIHAQALLSAQRGVTGAVVRGIDVESFSEVTILPQRIVEGRLDDIKPSFKEAAMAGKLPGVVVGRELSRTLGVWLGDTVNIITPSMGKAPRVAAFAVVGIFELGMYEYDSTIAFISLENAQTFFRLQGAVTGVEVKVKDIYRADSIRDEIAARLSGPYWLRTWTELNRNLFSALRLERAAMFIILTLIIAVAGLNIISTLIMVVMEKGKDIAILKSMGATQGGIMKIFMIEGVIIGLVGTLLGTVFGVIGALNLEAVVGFIERVFKFKILPPSVYYIDKLPSKVEPSVVLTVVSISLAISLLATLYPSWKASRVLPVEGLRYE
jgi:lipoprotein-releasing system permease protein